MKTAYFTICSRNYLAYALTLRQTLAEADPAAEFFIYLADDPPDESLGEDVRIIPAAQIAMPAMWDMALRYSVMEFNTAIKPFCILDLWDRQGFDAAVYIDPDIMVLRPLEAVRRAFAGGADCVLTPHLLQPLGDEFHPDDIQILRTGVYNLGFGAFARAPGARRFVEWWAKKCETDCVVDLENGLFVDQRLADYAPAFCERPAILRDPGYNAAYWNLKHRTIESTPDGWTANGAPLAFFHFSGVVPGDPGIFSKHQNRLQVGDIGDARILLKRYLSLLEANGHERWKKIPYAFDRFADGERISPEMRRVYMKSKHALITARERAFRPRYELFNALAPIAHSGANDYPVTRLMHEIYLARKDLHDLFALQTVDGRRGFTHWFLSSAPKEHGVCAHCLAPSQRALARADLARANVQAGAVALGGGLRPVVRSLYRNTPGLRAAYSALPANWRMNLRKAVLNVDAEADAAQARAAPTITNAEGDFDKSRRCGVDLYGYFTTESGVGEGARRAFAALQTAGVDVSTFTLGTQGVFKEAIDWPEDDLEAPPHRIALIHVNADQTPLLGRLVDPHRFKGSYRIGYWAWELSKFPDIWKPAFDLVDEIWAPSEFTAASIRNETEKPVRVIPHPASGAATGSPDRGRFGLPADGVVVFANLDLNSYLARKNPFVAIKAFREAFSDNSDLATLVLKTHGGKHVEAERRALREAIGGAKNIALIDQVLSPADLAALQASADIYLSMHRAEGFGLGIAEFMALGKPVVVTGYSGNMQFTDESNARLVGYDLVDVKDGEYPHGAGAKWAEPRLDDAVAALRELAGSPQVRAEIGMCAKDRISRRFSTAAIAALMRARLEEIDGELRAGPAKVRVSTPAG